MASRLPRLLLALLIGACDDGAPGTEVPSRPGHAPPDAGPPPVADGGGAPAVPLFDAFEHLADPDLPARALPGVTCLASSWAPTDDVLAWRNDDFGHFQGRDGDELVLVDAEGPGVMTRLWLTVRAMVDGGPWEPGDDVVLRFYVDGEELRFAADGRRLTLAELFGGEVPAFPAPWAANRSLASNAFMLSVPVPFQERFRLTAEDAPNLAFYYQVDYRLLGDGVRVRSFEGALRPSEAAALERATALWARGEHPASRTRSPSGRLAPGDALELTVDGPTVVRSLSAEALEGSVEALQAALTVDGRALVEAPLARLFAAEGPTAPYVSALSSLTPEGRMELAYPIRVDERLVLRVRNAGPDAVTLVLGAGDEPSAHDPALRRLRVSCGSPRGVSRTGLPLLEVEGRRGHYAGQFLRMRGGEAGWWMMEGDHRVRVDGEWTILGTGTEDYIGGAFYFIGGPFALPTNGATGWAFPRGGEHLTAPAVDVSMYRHHLLGTIPFEDSLRFEYEVSLQDAEYAHCVYWYADPAP